MRILSGKSTTWYDIQPPAQQDIDILRKELNIHSLVLEELVPAIHYPKLDLYSDHFFLVLQTPVLNPENGEVKIEEIDFIIGKSWIVTSHYRSLAVINNLFDRLTVSERAEHEYLSQPVEVLIYNILSAFLQSSLASLDRTEGEIKKIEEAIYSGQERKMVIAISELRRDIIDFRRGLSPARPVFRALDDIGPALLGAQSLPYFRNLTGRIEQISTLLKSQKETIEALEETNQALLTTRTNDVVKIFTILTALLLPPTIITSVFSMNLKYPFTVTPAVFWWIIGASFAVVIPPLIYFKRRGWL